jgi:hypothetical protein
VLLDSREEAGTKLAHDDGTVGALDPHLRADTQDLLIVLLLAARGGVW